jgi:hypothetical protein
MPCKHTAQLRGADGVLRCLFCGEEIHPTDKPQAAQTPAEKPTEESPTDKPKRTRKR